MVKQKPVTDAPSAGRVLHPATPPCTPERRRGWLWPHLLSLDAPLVALVWQDWWSRGARAPLLPGERIVLGLGVWLIYLADRQADVARGRSEDAGTARHTFAARWRWPLLALAVVVWASLVGLSPFVLPEREFRGGLGLLAVATVYFWLIHRGKIPRWTRRLPKEAVVGGMFAIGTLFFTFWQPGQALGSLMAGGLFFGWVCFLNCALITSWERSPRDRRDPASLLNAFPRLANGGLTRLCWLVALLSAALAWCAPLLLPISLSAVALAALDRSRRHLSTDALRCLADAVLLTPLLCDLRATVYW